MSEMLFEGYEAAEPLPMPVVSPDRRRTLRQSADIAAGRHPLTRGHLHPLASRHRDAAAPKGDPFTCGSCWFREAWSAGNKKFAKCGFGDGARMTSSVASDVRAWWPACPEYSPSDSMSPDAARSMPTPPSVAVTRTTNEEASP